MEHTVKSFEDDIEHLVEVMLSMKDMVIESIGQSEEALRGDNTDLYKAAKEKDKEVNLLEDKISDEAIKLLALRQPMAKDLRTVVSSIRIASLLERMGDRAKKSIKKSERLGDVFKREILEDVCHMNGLAINMVNNVFDNLVKYDSSNLQEAYKNDDEIDNYYTQVIKKIIKLQEKENAPLEDFITAIKIIKDYERIGDYASKIAKIVLYIAEAQTDF